VNAKKAVQYLIENSQEFDPPPSEDIFIQEPSETLKQMLNPLHEDLQQRSNQAWLQLMAKETELKGAALLFNQWMQDRLMAIEKSMVQDEREPG
jgi:hypothetical protein